MYADKPTASSGTHQRWRCVCRLYCLCNCRRITPTAVLNVDDVGAWLLFKETAFVENNDTSVECGYDCNPGSCWTYCWCDDSQPHTNGNQSTSFGWAAGFTTLASGAIFSGHTKFIANEWRGSYKVCVSVLQTILNSERGCMTTISGANSDSRICKLLP